MAPVHHQKQRPISTSNGSMYDDHSDQQSLSVVGYYNHAGRAQRRARSALYHGRMSSSSPDPIDTEEAQPALQALVSTGVLPGASRAPRTSRSIRHGLITNQEGSQFVLDWVRQNYTYEPNHNVPRSGMYEDYLVACMENDTQPVNSATFGKLIRHVLPDISTRRLGTRGQSKYHYCGIRRRNPDLDGGYAPGATLETDRINASGLQSGAVPISTQHNTRAGGALRVSTSAFMPASVGPADWQPLSTASTGTPGYGHSNVTRQQPSYYFYGTQQTPLYLDVRLPNFASFRDGVFLADPSAVDFARMYEQHCNDILKNLRTGNVDNIPNVIVMFYRNLPDNIQGLIVAQPEVVEAIWCWDCSLYDTIFQTLLPDVYAPVPYDTYRDLCSYIQNLQQTITNAMGKLYPERLIQQKCGVAAVFITQVKRHLSLNQMTQAASAILNYPSNLGLMLKDWENIDFNSVLDQSLWVCECDRQEVEALLLASIPHLLRTSAGIERWIGWTQKVVEKYMREALRANNSKGYCIFYARQLVVKWSYYMELVMKELTCNNAPSCDQFIKLHHFLGETIQYHVECSLAKTNWPDIQSGCSSTAANQAQDVFSDSSTQVGLRPNTPKSMQQEPNRQ